MVVDWEKIEQEYRAGIKSLRDISANYSISHVSISKRAKKYGWAKDLSVKIKAKADELVNRLAVNKEGNKDRSVNDQETIDANATVIYNVVVSHRTEIPKKREFVEKLFLELEAQTDGGDILEKMEMALQQNDMEKLADMARKASSLPARIKGASDLVSSYKTLVELERRVFKVDESSSDVDALSQVLSCVAKDRRSLVIGAD